MPKLGESANRAALETIALMVPLLLYLAQLALLMLWTILQVNVKHAQLVSIAQLGQVFHRNVSQEHILQVEHLSAHTVRWVPIVLMKLRHRLKRMQIYAPLAFTA